MATGSLKEVWVDIKGHPYITAGVVFIVGAVIIYAYYSTPTPVATQQADPNAGLASVEATQAQLAAVRAAADSANQSSANQVNGAVDIANIAGTAYAGSIAAGTSVDLAVIDANKAIALGTLAAYGSHDANVYDYLNNQLFSNERVAADQITTNSVLTQNVIADALGSRVIGTTIGNNTLNNAINQSASPAPSGVTNIFLPAGTTVQSSGALNTTPGNQ